MGSGSREKRSWEINFLRGIAVVVTLFHLLYDFSYLAFEYDIDVASGFWIYFARATATIFTLGLSFWLLQTATT